MHSIATFSIVAYDSDRREWGVAVQSKFLAAAAVVSWAQAKAGAVATQAHANLTYGPQGLQMMEKGLTAEDTIEALISTDEHRTMRQVGIVDREGRAAAYTGADCIEWAGHVIGAGFTCQGNILVRGTVEAMAGALAANWRHFIDYVGLVIFAVFLHNALALNLGYWSGRAVKLPERDCRATCIEVGIQNSALGLVLVFNFFDGLGGMAILVAWWGVWHIISGLTTAFIFTRRALPNEEV